MIKKYITANKGMTLPLVIFIFLVVMIVTYSLAVRQTSHVLSFIQKDGIDKATQLADAGIEIAIKYLRSDPHYIREPGDNKEWTGGGSDPRPPFHQPVAKELDNRGEIIFTVQEGATSGEKIVISSGIYTHGKISVTKAVRAVLEVESPGSYFCASITDFKIGAGAEMHKGDGIIYGNVLEFAKGPPPSTVYEAQYTSDCLPTDDPVQLAADGYTQFMSNPGLVRDINKVFPVISQELMKYYYDIAYNDGVDSSFFDPDTHSDLKIPTLMSGMSTNNSNIFYYPAIDPETTVPVDITIDGLQYDFIDTNPTPPEPKSCIIVVNGNLTITGDIINKKYVNNPKNSDDPNSDQYALAFIVLGDVTLDIDAMVSSELNLQGVLFLAINGKFKVYMKPAQPKKQQLNLFGGALFRDSFDIARGFDNRWYQYDKWIKEIPNLPFMVSVKSYRPVTAR